MSLEEKGDVVEAIDKYNKVLEINPKHAGAYMNLGNMFILCGDYNYAINNLDSIAFNPAQKYKISTSN